MGSEKNTETLNSEQHKAAKHKNGPALIVAGAGTGKTKVIIERLTHLINGGVPKKNILCLTFTEKAAQEMLDRAGERLEDSYGTELNIFTFNGFGSLILGEFSPEIGLSSNLKLIGDNGKVVLLREHLDDLGLDYFAPVSRPDGQLANIASYFSQLKQQLVNPVDYISYAKNLSAKDEAERLEKIRHAELSGAYKTYIDITRSKNIIDYDDQIYLLIELLEQRPNVLKVLLERYRYIMVDEFQDTNPMQSRLIDLLSGDSKNLFAVGDDDQSIYGWRGATLANILDFTKRYPKASEITLIQNYRNVQEILDSSWQMIQNNNPNRLEAINKLDKRLIADRGSGDNPVVRKFSRLDFELSWIAEDIKRRIKEGTKPDHIAVLARRKQTVNLVHAALEAKDVEHTVSGISDSLYHHPLVAALINCLKTIVNRDDQNALYHTLSGPLFNCDPQVLSTLSNDARRNFQNLEDLASASTNSVFVDAIALINTWRSHAATRSVREICYHIISDSGYKDYLSANAYTDPEIGFGVQVIGQWFSTLEDFEQVTNMPTTVNYLENLPALEAEDEVIADDTIYITPDLPVVMTAHKAKGLEWPIVYIADCTQGSFPLKPMPTSLQVPAKLSKASTADDHYAEERRLMYVASTRARDELILTLSDSHNGVTKRKPSQFLVELLGDMSHEIHDQQDTQGSLLPEYETASRKQTVNLPPKMYNGSQLTLTASQADDYLACPLNFYHKHVLCVPEPASSNTVVGSLFHGFLQDINNALKNGKPVPSLEPMLETLKSEWPTIGFRSKSERERLYAFSKDALIKLYARISEGNNTIPLEVEVPFNVHLPGSKLSLIGRIDVILPAGEGIEIRDYKTSTGVDTPERAKSRVSSNNQLTIYSVAWRHLRGEDPVQVALDFVQTGQLGVLKKRSSSLDTMEKKLVEAADNIVAGNFPLGASHEFCIHP